MFPHLLYLQCLRVENQHFLVFPCQHVNLVFHYSDTLSKHCLIDKNTLKDFSSVGMNYLKTRMTGHTSAAGRGVNLVVTYSSC